MKHTILLLILTSCFASCAAKSPAVKFDAEHCESITPQNAPICDPDGDLANGDYDAA